MNLLFSDNITANKNTRTGHAGMTDANFAQGTIQKSKLDAAHCFAALGDPLGQAPCMKNMAAILQLDARLSSQLRRVANAAEFITRGGGTMRFWIAILVQTHNVFNFVTEADTCMSALVFMTTRLGPCGLAS